MNCRMNRKDIRGAADLIIDNHGDRAEFVAYGSIVDMIVQMRFPRADLYGSKFWPR
jgi:hypothetical protein